MKIQEACRRAGVTRKAALVAAEQGLLTPARQENGYRDFTEDDVTRLARIAVLRGLGLPGAEIRAYFAGDFAALGRAAMAERLRRQRAEDCQRALEDLARTGDWAAARAALDAIEARESLAERLLRAFPGYFGDYLALHFSSFLQEPLQGEAQRAAFDQVVAYLDGVSVPEFSPEARAFLAQAAEWYTPSRLATLHDAVVEAAEHPKRYLEDHGDAMEAWRQMQSAIPPEHPLWEIRRALAALTSSPGYQEIFLPAMRRLSPAYDRYAQSLAQADAMLGYGEGRA